MPRDLSFRFRSNRGNGSRGCESMRLISRCLPVGSCVTDSRRAIIVTGMIDGSRGKFMHSLRIFVLSSNTRMRAAKCKCGKRRDVYKYCMKCFTRSYNKFHVLPSCFVRRSCFRVRIRDASASYQILRGDKNPQLYKYCMKLARFAGSDDKLRL